MLSLTSFLNKPRLLDIKEVVYHAHTTELISNLPLLSLWTMMFISADDDKLLASELDPLIMLSLSTLALRDLDESTLHSLNFDCGLLVLKY